MPRPRKSIRLLEAGKGIRTELISVYAESEEQRKRLLEAYDLVVAFIRLAPARAKKVREERELSDAA
jgi:hypothetical protein